MDISKGCDAIIESLGGNRRAILDLIRRFYERNPKPNSNKLKAIAYLGWYVEPEDDMSDDEQRSTLLNIWGGRHE